MLHTYHYFIASTFCFGLGDVVIGQEGGCTRVDLARQMVTRQDSPAFHGSVRPSRFQVCYKEKRKSSAKTGPHDVQT